MKTPTPSSLLSDRPLPLRLSPLCSLGSHPSTFKKIPRGRLLLNNVNKVFDVNADYVKDAFGEYIWPDEWMLQCVTAPATYFIIEKEIEPQKVRLPPQPARTHPNHACGRWQSHLVPQSSQLVTGGDHTVARLTCREERLPRAQKAPHVCLLCLIQGSLPSA